MRPKMITLGRTTLARMLDLPLSFSLRRTSLVYPLFALLPQSAPGYTIEEIMKFGPATTLIALLLLGQCPNLAPAQQSPQQQTTPDQTQSQTQSTPDQSPPVDGGPTGDNGAIAIPKKSEPATPPPERTLSRRPPPPPRLHPRLPRKTLPEWAISTSGLTYRLSHSMLVSFL